MKTGTISCLVAACGLAGAASAQVTISQSNLNTVITAGNSVACATNLPFPAPQQTTANAYFRSYTLSAFPAITGPFNVTSVTFGVENAIHPDTTQMVRVRLYKDTDGGAPVAVGTDLVQVAENAAVAVPDGAAQFITAPITGNFLQSDTLVVSVDTPDYTAQYGPGMPGGDLNAVFFIGSNLNGETGPSYLQAADCGLATPATTAFIGFPNMHIIIDVTGTIGTAGCYPDCNLDTILNLSDFGCFTTKFALGDAYADCNGDGIRNLADFGCFTTKFALGCP